jgi:hypothetical protein
MFTYRTNIFLHQPLHDTIYVIHVHTIYSSNLLSIRVRELINELKNFPSCSLIVLIGTLLCKILVFIQVNLN